MFNFRKYLNEQTTISAMGSGKKKQDDSVPSMFWAQRNTSSGYGQPRAAGEPEGGGFDPEDVDFLDPSTWPGDRVEFDAWFDLWYQENQQWVSLMSRNTISMLGGHSFRPMMDEARQYYHWMMMMIIMDPNVNPNMVNGFGGDVRQPPL